MSFPGVWRGDADTAAILNVAKKRKLVGLEKQSVVEPWVSKWRLME